ncbi:MAG: hypothetical protein GX096_14665 [Clostridiales bacterium]|nr:hypothetical protein [Clostridiales bacterium]
MASIVNGFKTAVLKGMEAVGKGASNMASNAQQKLSEINLESRRREILSEFPMRAFDLWQKGEVLPESLSAMLQEISDLDEHLNVIRAQRYAKVESHSTQSSEAENASNENAEAPESDDIVMDEDTASDDTAVFPAENQQDAPLVDSFAEFVTAADEAMETSVSGANINTETEEASASDQAPTDEY